MTESCVAENLSFCVRKLKMYLLLISNYFLFKEMSSTRRLGKTPLNISPSGPP